MTRPHDGDSCRRPIRGVVGEEDRAISVISVSELLHGLHRASAANRSRRAAFVEHRLGELHAIPITAPIARNHAEIWAELGRRGERIGAHDVWMAATALAHGLAVATGKPGEFQRVPGLRGISSPA